MGFQLANENSRAAILGKSFGPTEPIETRISGLTAMCNTCELGSDVASDEVKP